MVVPGPSSDPPGGPGRESGDWATGDVLVSSPRRPAGRLGRWLAGLSPLAKTMVGFVAVLVVAAGVVAVRGAVTGSGAQQLADRCPDAYRGGPVSGVSCADGVFQLAMLVPVAVRVPAQWLLVVRQPGSDESTVKPPNSAPDQGVWIYEDVVPMRSTEGAQPTTDRSAGGTASSIATWLASRPYLEPTHVVKTRVAGLPAFRVDLTVDTGASPGTAGGQPTPRYATFALPSDPGAVTWESAGVPVRYTLLDLPRGGVLVIRTLRVDQSQAVTNQAILNSLQVR